MKGKMDMIYIKEEVKTLTLRKIVEGIINELPREVNITIGDRYNDPDTNIEIAKEIVEKYDYIDDFIYNKNTFQLYRKIEGSDIYYALLLNHNNITYVGLSYDIRLIKLYNLDGCESVNVIQSIIIDRSAWKELARDFLFNYLLKNYNFVMSDKVHTARGKVFWEFLLIRALNHKYFCYAVNEKSGDIISMVNIDKSQFNSFYDEAKKDYQFIISNVKIETNK